MASVLVITAAVAAAAACRQGSQQGRLADGAKAAASAGQSSDAPPLAPIEPPAERDGTPQARRDRAPASTSPSSTPKLEEAKPTAPLDGAPAPYPARVAEPPPRAAPRSGPGPATPAPTQEVAQLEFSAELAAPQAALGAELVGGLAWTDQLGLNTVLLGRRLIAGANQSLLLVAKHFRKRRNSEWSLVRKVQQPERDCEFDLMGEFLEPALAVTDLDEDGVGEATFAYRYTCTSDVSPFTLKVFVLEDGAKYVVRGTTRLRFPGEPPMGGEKRLGQALAKADPRFIRHANATWARVVDHPLF